MARVTYQASAQDRSFAPNLVPDTSDRILKQSEDYIEKLKAARDFQAAQDAQFITEYTAGLQRGVDSQRQVDLEQERQARALATYKQGLLADQARRAKTLGGSVTGDDAKTNKWLNFIVEASGVAAETFGTIKEINDKHDIQVATELNAMFGVNPVKIGEDMKLSGARQVGARINAAATIAENRGDHELANRLRSMNTGQKAEFDRLQAIGIGRNFGTSFQRDVYRNDSLMDVMIDGEMRPLNSLRTASEFEQARPQYRDAYFRAAGIDPTSALAVDGLIQSQKSWESMMAGVRQSELAADKNNLFDEADTAFTIKVQDPDNAQEAVIDFYQSNYNLNGGDHKAARTAVMEAFKNPGQTSNEAFLAFQQTVLPGQTKSIGELYGDEIREVRQARLSESSQIQSESDVQQKTEAKAEAQRVYQARLLDAEEDGDVDLSPENVQAQIEKYTRLGPNWDEARQAWEALVPELSSTKRDEELNDDFQALADRGALSEDFIMRSDGSEQLKRKWLKSVNATAEQGVSKEDIEDFEDLARTMLMDRTGETPGMTGRSQNAYTKRALRYAVKQYRKDYVTALRDGRTAAQAAEYAEGRFNAAFISETGKYRVTKATETKDGDEIVVGQYSNFGPNYSAEMEEPFVDIKKKFEELGPAAVDTPGVIPRTTLERVQKSLQQNNRIMIPPNIVFMADYSGGKLSVMDVLNRQLKAAGLEQIPPDIFNTAKETQDSIAPEWQQRLNYKPQYSTVDAAMIGSGQEPIYNQRIPASVENDTEFQREVYSMADRLGVQASDLFAIMDFETGGTFDPAQRNSRGSGATGLIQFMPSTAAGLGTSTDQLASMSRVQQLQYVEQYFKSTGIQPGASLSDLYMAVLFPAAIGKSDDFVLFGNGAMSGYGGRAYDQNRGLDKDGNGSITKGEAAVKVLGSANVWRQRRNLNPAVIPAIPQEPEQAQATELTGYYKFDEDGNKIPAN